MSNSQFCTNRKTERTKSLKVKIAQNLICQLENQDVELDAFIG